MGFLDFLTGAGGLSDPKGFDIKREDFEIKDVDKLFGQSQSQLQEAEKRGAAIAPKRESFLTALEQSAMGQGPSLAAEQIKQTQERNLAQQLALAQGQTGGNAAGLQRQLFRAQQAGAAQTAQAGGQAALAEQAQNRQLYQQALGQEQAAVDNLTQKYLSMGFDMRSAQQQALADYNKLQVNQALGLAGIKAQQEQARAGAQSGLIGGILQGGAGLMAANIKGKADLAAALASKK